MLFLTVLLAAVLALAHFSPVEGDLPLVEGHFSSVEGHFSPVQGAADSGNCACSNKLVRKEWRTLSKKEKLSYISAVTCLQNKPARLSTALPGSKSRFDDYQGVHINLTDFYHFTGPFHPWHRLYVKNYESELRSLCGYTGTQPYWDWTQDATSEAAFLASPVFDPITGFGGNGPYINTTGFTTTNVPVHIPYKTGGGCVENGPFTNMTVNMGPGPSIVYNPRCLARDFSPWLSTRTLNASIVQWGQSSPQFAVYDYRTQGTGLGVSGMTYHAGGHLSVGGDIGDMGNMYSSPGDPLFFLHHANLDRLWNQWQRANWTARKMDIAGPDTKFAYPFDFLGEVAYKNITLDTVLHYGGLFEDTTISSVMDINSDNLCYTYF